MLYAYPILGGDMKKKVIFLALLLSLCTAFSAFAYKAAIGGEYALKVGDSLPASALLSFRLPKFPVVFGLGLSVNKDTDTSSLVILADWWMWQGHLFSFINYYVGPGAFLGISNDSTVLGVRVPFGINCYPVKPLELFIELAPAMALLTPSGVNIPDWGIQAGFGFRFWF
jgi:hypothetical protein